MSFQYFATWPDSRSLVSMNVRNKEVIMDNQQLANKFVQMDQELRFLWQEANEAKERSLKDRKLKQYWELFKAYKKQKEFLIALES